MVSRSHVDIFIENGSGGLISSLDFFGATSACGPTGSSPSRISSLRVPNCHLSHLGLELPLDQPQDHR